MFYFFFITFFFAFLHSRISIQVLGKLLTRYSQPISLSLSPTPLTSSPSLSPKLSLPLPHRRLSQNQSPCRLQISPQVPKSKKVERIPGS
ncbi:hypothetical protein DM02DRAFT_616331 [Periconia macrospinosa]|uniref:Uncharacterized protein n=1 Tax=Periconia macrospinosa TaxID=97972 RepID=A0A2V1DIC6_9PLEO|nr:hypothetical protein DM02DRAFT_616331 [Periconia macrospinosa]